MVSLPNIYKSKHMRYFIAVPLILLLVGLYLWLFSGRFTYDSSLSGGVSIIIQANSTFSSSQLAAQISQKLHTSTPSIQASPGGLQITLVINQSLSNAESQLLGFYAFKQNYSASTVNATALSIALQRDPTNQILAGQLSNANANSNASLVKMKNAIGKELVSLSPFIGNSTQVPASPDQMLAIAQNSYSNASSTYKNNIVSTLHTLVPFTTYSYEQLTPTLGKYFLGQLRSVIVLAFVLISIIVFFIFRSPVPAFAVIFGAANDIIIALGAMSLFGIPLGIASIGGLLMLIGYSIDTDLLTAVRILKRHGETPEERAYSSMKTGLTMTATAIISFAVLFVVSIFTYVPTYYEIAGVVFFGFIADIATTWLGNASIILLYKKRKDGQ